jgi:hypothetical protein
MLDTNLKEATRVCVSRHGTKGQNLRSTRGTNDLPEARLDDISIEELPNEVLIYDRRRDVAHCLDATASRVWAACRDKQTESAFLDAHPDIDAATLRMALAELRAQSLLAESPLIVSTAMSRRQLVGATAAAAVGATMVTSIVAPTPAHAATGTACSPPNFNMCPNPADMKCGLNGAANCFCCPPGTACSAVFNRCNTI